MMSITGLSTFLVVEPVISERRLYVCSPPEADRGKQEGESPAFRAGKGQVFPFLSNPIGSLRKPLSEGIMGSTCELKKDL